MFDTYYLRLGMHHPKELSKMDTSKGLIIAETAGTGKFFIQELEFINFVDTNPESGVGYNIRGNIRIAEPMGCRLMDYLRLSAARLGIINWLDSRYLLEIELRAENYDPGEFRYVYPIVVGKLEMKSISEKGTDWNFPFVGNGSLVQTDMLQPIPDTITVKDVKTVGQYFKKFETELEKQQFRLAEARQKAGGKKPGGGDHPAAGDQYHDEYYFIVDPKLKSYEFKTKEIHDPGKDTSYENKSRQNREKNEKIDITAKKGTTISSQIIKVLQMSKGVEDMKPGKEKPQTKDAQGSSAGNKSNNEGMLSEIHQYYRIATHTVYKKYDHVRGRYAMKQFYAIYLTDQPNLQHFPEELDLVNSDKHLDKLTQRLDKLITRGLLRKAYYHWYTGLNVDVIKADLELNKLYYLPGVPNYWAADYNQTTDGRMEDAEKYNWEKKKTPYSYGDADPPGAEYTDSPQNAPYAEDMDYAKVSQYLLKGYPQLRPRMEAGEVIKQHGNEHDENTYLAQKIHEVLTSPFDIMKLDLEIIGDPWWLGHPDVMMSGKKGLEKTKMPEGIKKEIDSVLPGKDPDYNTREIKWTSYANAQPWFNGSPQLYYCAQLPSNDTQDDLMVFDYADSISGIYQVTKVRNSFKEGKWVQVLETKRNVNVPSKIIPRFVNGKFQTFDDYMNGVLSREGNTVSGNQGTNYINPSPNARLTDERNREIENAGLSSQNPNFGAEERTTQDTVSSDSKVQSALARRRELEQQFPAPTVNNPVTRAEELVGQGISKEQAYAQAKKEFIDQLRGKFEHLDKLNEQAYNDAKVDKYRPYDPDTLIAIALEKSNNGGLEDWRKNTNWKGPATLNNPGGLGHDVRTGRYNRYDTFDQGVTAINDYFNYGVGVPAGRQGANRYLLPKDFTGTSAPSVTGNTELRYVNNVSKGRPGGRA